MIEEKNTYMIKLYKKFIKNTKHKLNKVIKIKDVINNFSKYDGKMKK